MNVLNVFVYVYPHIRKCIAQKVLFKLYLLILLIGLKKL